MLVLLSKCIYIILYRDNLFPNARGMACRPQKKSTGQNATTSRAFPAAFPAPGSSKARACRLTPSSKTPGPDARPKKSPAPISPEHPPRHRPARAALRQDHTALERMRILLDENAPSGLRRILATTCALHPKWAGPATPTGSYSTKPKKPVSKRSSRGSKLAVSAESHRPKYRRHHFLHQCLAHHSHPATDGAARGRECLTRHFHLCHLSPSATIPAPACTHVLNSVRPALTNSWTPRKFLPQ